MSTSRRPVSCTFANFRVSVQTRCNQHGSAGLRWTFTHILIADRSASVGSSAAKICWAQAPVREVASRPPTNRCCGWQAWSITFWWLKMHDTARVNTEGTNGVWHWSSEGEPMGVVLNKDGETVSSYISPKITPIEKMIKIFRDASPENPKLLEAALAPPLRWASGTSSASARPISWSANERSQQRRLRSLLS